MADWTMISYKHDDCYHFTCAVTIRNIPMNYSHGTLFSVAAVSFNDVRHVNYTRIFVTQGSDDDHTKSIPTLVYYIVAGVCATGIVALTVICLVFVIKRRYQWFSSHSIYQDYESIPSSGKIHHCILVW